MNDFLRRFRNLSSNLGLAPDLRADWKWLLLLAVMVYAFAFSVRMLDFGHWQHPGLTVQGEYIAATHDSYSWMAGAEGVGDYVQYPFSKLTGFLGRISGSPLGDVAFWAPAFLASLVAPVTLLWGWLLAGRTAGLAAGLLGAILPGFYVRSRLGYWDTDVFTLLMPLLAAFLLTVLVRPRLGRDAGEREGPDEARRLRSWPWLALVFGVVARSGGLWHADILNVVLLSYALAVFLVLVLGGRQRAAGLFDLLVFGMAAFEPWGPWQPYAHMLAGIAVAAALAAVPGLPGPHRRLLDNRWIVLGLLAALLLVVGFEAFPDLFSKLALYLMPSAESGAVSAKIQSPVYPAIIQSIRETRLLDLADYLGRAGGAVWASVIGLLGFAFLLVVRPEAATLLPLVGIGLLGLKLGARFAMFGGPCLMLGLGCCLDFLVRRLAPEGVKGSVVALAGQAVLALALVWPLSAIYKEMPPTPVLDMVHAESLLALRTEAPSDAEVWTWWDYGYAAQYYAKRMTPADGGKHAGRDVYPLALALTTDSCRQAAQIIKYSAAQHYDPAAKWDTMPATAVRDLVGNMRQADLKLPDTPPQYLVVTWENLNLAYWITYFGSWDLVDGTSSGVQTIRPHSFEVDTRNGGIAMRQTGQVVALSSLDVVSTKGHRHEDFAGNVGPHLVINPDRADAYLLDDRAYNSMMVRLLISDPQSPEVAPYFKLVVDHFPHVRIYRVQ